MGEHEHRIAVEVFERATAEDRKLRPPGRPSVPPHVDVAGVGLDRRRVPVRGQLPSDVGPFVGRDELAQLTAQSCRGRAAIGRLTGDP
jgi:hypothetical protein